MKYRISRDNCNMRVDQKCDSSVAESFTEIGHNELAPNGAAGVAGIVVGRIDAATVEVQVVAVGGAIRGRGPVVAIATDVIYCPIRASDASGTREANLHKEPL